MNSGNLSCGDNMKSKIQDCRIIELPKIFNKKGNITPVHGNIEVPFDLKRVFYIYDIPGGESRGAHAHKTLEQFIVCALGNFDVTVDDGKNRDVIHLSRANKGLYIPPMIWAAEINFSSGSICLVLTSDYFDESDYYRDYGEYLEGKFRKCRNEL